MNGPMRVSRRRIAVFVAVLGFLASVAAGAPGVLTNGVAVTGLSGSVASQVFYMIDVPSGQEELEFVITGGTGDCDLYVRKDAEPTVTTYDYRPYKIGNEETVTIDNPEAGTWYVMLSAYKAYANMSLVATYSSGESIVSLKSGQAVTGLAGDANSELYFSIEVPSDQTELEISISGSNGDCDMYVKRGALPGVSDYDYRPFLPNSNETVSVSSPAAGTWYIMLRGYSSYYGLTLIAAYDGGVGTALDNGVPLTGLAGTQDSEKLYRIEVPSDQRSLEIMMTDGTGDCDVYVRYGTPPTLTDYDYRPYLVGKDEDVSITYPNAGTWYIMLHGSAAYSGVTLTATYDDVLALEDEEPVTDLEGEITSEVFFKIDVPSGKTKLEIEITDGTGNCDLYVRYGVKPTTTEWDYRPYLSDNDETVSITYPDAGTWYIMLRGRLAYSGVTLVADYWFSGTVTLMDNGVPETDISDKEDGEKYFRMIVPSDQDTFEVAMSGGTGDADLYVKLGSLPTTKSYDYRPYQLGNDETVTVENPEYGNWLIMIRAYEDYAGVSLVATYGTGGSTGKVVELTNGVAVKGLSGEASSETFYKIEVPSGQSSLEIAMSGGTGDVDLYVRKDGLPTVNDWDYRPYSFGNDETVSIDNPEAGTYYIMLRAYSDYDDVTLVATYTAVADGVTELDNGVPVSDLSGKVDDELFYKIVVPAGQDDLSIVISGGTGDCDLYVRKGSKPTASSYDYRPYLKGNEETVDVANPAAATWYIMLRGGEAFSGVTLVASYGATGTGNVFTADPDCVALWSFEPDALRVDSIGTNTLSNYGVTSELGDFREGDGGALFVSTEEDWMSIGDADLSEDFPTREDDIDVEMSICFWMKANTFAYEDTIISKYLITTDDRSWRIFVGNQTVTTGVLSVGLGTGSGTTFNTYSFDETEQLLDMEHWYHVGFTYRDEDKTYHVRVWDATAGSLLYDVTGTAPYRLAVNDAPIVLGNLAMKSRHFDGVLDEMVIFRDILTTDEIDQIRQGSYGYDK